MWGREGCGFDRPEKTLQCNLGRPCKTFALNNCMQCWLDITTRKVELPVSIIVKMFSNKSRKFHPRVNSAAKRKATFVYFHQIQSLGANAFELMPRDLQSKCP